MTKRTEIMLIAAAARKAGCHVDTIRNYITRGQLDPVRDSSGRALFTSQDVNTIRGIYLDNLNARRGENA